MILMYFLYNTLTHSPRDTVLYQIYYNFLHYLLLMLTIYLFSVIFENWGGQGFVMASPNVEPREVNLLFGQIIHLFFLNHTLNLSLIVFMQTCVCTS